MEVDERSGNWELKYLGIELVFRFFRSGSKREYILIYLFFIFLIMGSSVFI